MVSPSLLYLLNLDLSSRRFLRFRARVYTARFRGCWLASVILCRFRSRWRIFRGEARWSCACLPFEAVLILHGQIIYILFSSWSRGGTPCTYCGRQPLTQADCVRCSSLRTTQPCPTSVTELRRPGASCIFQQSRSSRVWGRCLQCIDQDWI